MVLPKDFEEPSERCRDLHERVGAAAADARAPRAQRAEELSAAEQHVLVAGSFDLLRVMAGDV